MNVEKGGFTLNHNEQMQPAEPIEADVVSVSEGTVIEPDKGNVLVIGNSGVGKSTLINTLLGEHRAETSWGTEGTTKELKIYESDDVPFRVIDTVGFEPTLLGEHRAIGAVKKWSKETLKAGGRERQINMIWFCVDGTSRKLFPKTIQNLTRATSMWKSVPIVVVITKSYSTPDREENIRMVNQAFAGQKRSCNLQAVIPVVAETYMLNESAYAPPEGITELIDKTVALMPEGIQAAAHDMSQVRLSRCRIMAHGVVGTATAAAATVGAVPIPIADAMLLAPLEAGELNAIAMVYGYRKDERSKVFQESIIKVGTISAAAKAIISAIKAIPGLNIAASTLNAVIAGTIAAAIGEATIYAYEQVYLGKKSFEDIEWVQQMVSEKLAGLNVGELIPQLLGSTESLTDAKTIAKLILKLLKNKK